VTESDLHELFSYFGRISRVHIPKDKETMQSRGFGFVTYCRKTDAESAMKGLQGHGYDYMILNLEWATPRQTPSIGADMEDVWRRIAASTKYRGCKEHFQWKTGAEAQERSYSNQNIVD